MIAVAVLAVALGACGGDGDEQGSLDELQIVGIDFQLNSIILTNRGVDEVRTQGLWIYQNGEVSQFDIFRIEPRSEVLFPVRDVGGVTPSGGEIALFSADSFSDPEAVIDYVSWGSSGHSRANVAIDGGHWSLEGPVETGADTVVLLRANPDVTGSSAWVANDEIP